MKKYPVKHKNERLSIKPTTIYVWSPRTGVVFKI